MDGQTATVTPPLELARVVFTGRLASMRRAEAEQMVRAAGGVPVASVSRRTNMLVVGMHGWPLLPDGSVSRKLRRAEALARTGSPIAVISEEEFLEVAGLSERRPTLRKSYPADQVSGLVGIDEAVLRRWEALGLVRSADGWYDFQDLVSLRTIVELLDAGASLQTIGDSIRGLASVLPGTERPLAQLKIVTEGPGTLLAELGELRVAPDGQLMLDFAGRGPDAPDAAIDSVPFDAGKQRISADNWFDRALAYEQDERWTEAEHAYRKVLAIEPNLPEALFNIANVLRSMGRLEAAEERYRVALEHDPTLAVGWYNLADLIEETGRIDEAINCLNRAIAMQPDYADAYFNLAHCCEQAGCRDAAARHWRAYLQLDPRSEWADIARTHLSG